MISKPFVRPIVVAALVLQACSSTAPDHAGVVLEQVPAGFESAPRIGTDSRPPKLVRREDPRTPRDLSGINAVLTAEVYVSEAGGVVGVRYVRGDRRLIRPLAEAASHWRFEPFSIAGAPERWVMPVTFSLTWSGSPPAPVVTIR